MSEDDLDMLITLDDPGEGEEVEAKQLPVQDTVIGSGPYPVVFGEGDWTCAVSRLALKTYEPVGVLIGNMGRPTDRKFEIDVCLVTCSKNGKIVEQKVFYDLVGLQKQIGIP